jgi:hypothetical protein
MITPSFALTATERVLPKLALDFTTAVLDPRVTFTRAGNTATVTDQLGAIVLVNADIPRFDYANGVCKGLLIEEARTNLFINSIWDGAVAGTPGTTPTSWGIGFGTGSIVSVSSGVYAAGNAVRLAATAGRQFFTQSFTAAANTTYSVSVKCTLNSGTIGLSDLIDAASVPAGGTKTWLLNGVVVPFSTTVPAGNNTLGLSIAIAATAGTPNVRIGIGCGQNRTANATFDMPQVEAGAFATSYIPTTLAQVTRTADVATMTGTNFSDWYSAGAGGVVARVLPSTVSGTRPALQFDDNTADELINLRGNTTNPELVIVDGGSPQAQIDAGTIAANTAYNLGAAWNTDNCAAAINGEAAVTDSTATIPTVTQARLGSDGTNYLNGFLQTVRYWPQRIINTEVQAFSK